MTELNPLVLVGAVIGAVTALLVLAYALVKDKKESMGFERTMADSEICAVWPVMPSPTAQSLSLSCF